VDEHSAASRWDVAGPVVARIGRVVPTGDPGLPWAVLDGVGAPVEPVAEFLRDLLACGSSPASCRSYAFDLLRWFRFLAAVDVE
jgi:integrase/recombinase XerC